MHPKTEAAAAGGESARRPRVTAVVTHHIRGFRSGVARFNELLAHELAVPLYRLDELGEAGLAGALLSFKVSELPEGARAELAAAIARSSWDGELFLHEWSDLDLERDLVQRASRVHCGNLEILERAATFNPEVTSAWAPGLVVDRRRFEPAEITIFSFGMAHKIQTEMFRRLRELLDADGRSYAVYVSAANHETASLEDAEAVFEEMHEIFPHLYFLGNLSDVAVHNRLCQSTFFAAFFPKGVRANNTTVAAAMETGAVVITNLDRYSPPEYVHMENVIDIERCEELPADAAVLERLRAGAVETARARGWDALVDRMKE